MYTNISRTILELTIVKYEAVRKLKPFDYWFILCIAWKDSKASLFCTIKFEYELFIFNHFLKNKIKESMSLNLIWSFGADFPVLMQYINVASNKNTIL